MNVITGATDVGCVALWDPRAVGVDSSLRINRDNLMTHYRRLARDQSLLWIETCSDGEYLLHVYVGEIPPERLQANLTQVSIRESFQAPSGQLWFAGGEYVSRNSNPLGEYTHMGSSFSVRPGTYRVTAWEVKNDDPSLKLPSLVVTMEWLREK